MTFQRLSGRIGLPFALLVLAGSALLMLIMGWHLANDDRDKFEKLVRTNADFMNRVKLPPSPRMSSELQEVLGVTVLFRRDGMMNPHPRDSVLMKQLLDLPADGQCHVLGTLEAVGVPLDSGDDLILIRDGFAFRNVGWTRSVLPVLTAFWLLALFVAWLVSRSLVRPLRHLAAKLPEIEKPGPLDLPEAQRNDEIGDVARAFVRTRDALQAEKAEREQAEKLAVLGRMTAALAHEIQNPVSAIKMHAQLWQHGSETSGQTAGIIESEATRIESLVNQWMFLSRPHPPVMAETDVSRLLRQVVNAHQSQLDHTHVRVTLDAPGPLLVLGDAKRLTQVFSNLLLNAMQAMPHGGPLGVLARASSTTVEITFSDAGAGFSPHALARFSEFFYSEKEGGMGIGLSVASEIIKAHGGNLHALNHPQGGARVTVTLPASQSVSRGAE